MEGCTHGLNDPTAEVAARTWIDQYSSLDRRELLEKPYYEWLSAEADVNCAVRELNNGEFLPNACEEYEVAEDETQRRGRIMAGIQRMNEGSAPASHPEPLNGNSATEVQDTVAVGEDATGQDAFAEEATDQEAVGQQAARSTGEQTFERMVEKSEARERRERNEQQQSRQNTARARSGGGGKMRSRLPPSSEVNRLQDKPFVGKAEREVQQARERRETEI